MPGLFASRRNQPIELVLPSTFTTKITKDTKKYQLSEDSNGYIFQHTKHSHTEAYGESRTLQTLHGLSATKPAGKKACVTPCGSVVNYSASACAPYRFVPLRVLRDLRGLTLAVLKEIFYCGFALTASSVFSPITESTEAKIPFTRRGQKPDPGVPTTCASASN